METAILIVHVLVGIAIIGLILIQQGKGADVGASFGSGASQTFFGSSGSGNVLTRTTTILVSVFFLTSIGLAYVAQQHARDAGQITAPLVQPANPAKVNAAATEIPSTETAPAATETQKPADEIPK
jgi:preprotein translocase subunit SecG